MTTLEKYATVITIIGGCIGIVGGTVGFVGGCISLSDWYRNRTSRLDLSIPAWFTGNTAQGKHLCLLARILNRSKKDAYLLAETLEVELYADGKWHAADVGWVEDSGFLKTDFNKGVKVLLGAEEVAPIRRYETLLSQNVGPATRYITVSCKPEHVLDRVQKVKIRLKDGSYVEHTMEADIPSRQIATGGNEGQPSN